MRFQRLIFFYLNSNRKSKMRRQKRRTNKNRLIFDSNDDLKSNLETALASVLVNVPKNENDGS